MEALGSYEDMSGFAVQSVVSAAADNVDLKARKKVISRNGKSLQLEANKFCIYML